MLIQVKTQFLDEHSEPENDKFVFSYTIRITNNTQNNVQLISRYWHIEDAKLEVQEVKGLGVVGEQPKLTPGESFTYTSGTVLNTPFATMQGHYDMQTENGDAFQAPIAPFSLAYPKSIH